MRSADLFRPKEHSSKDQNCYLWIYGIHILMYSLGDKYDIPGLRKISRERFDESYAHIDTLDWEHDIKVFEMVYQYSRPTDDLRKSLIERLCKFLIVKGDRDGLQRQHRFGPFIDNSPELTGPLLQELLRRL